MIRHTFVTLCAILLLTGVSQPSNPHVISVSAQYDTPYPSPHVMLGIAVLGHNVGKIERGWLVKQKGEGFLHIDWSRGGDWTGLKRTEEGPRDLSQAQLDAVVGGIVRLGIPPTSIRSWRVAAPVGYDGFGEGDKVLMIGEILIDLGTPQQANATLPKLYDAVVEKDALDHFPRTNVRPVEQLYFMPDCSAMRDALAKQARIDADRAVSKIVAQTHVVAKFLQSYVSTPYNVLCSQEEQPNFYNAGVTFPSSVSSDDFTPVQNTQTYYGIAGHSTDTRLTADPGDLSSSSTRSAFDLPEPYVATIAKGEIPIVPDWYLFHIHYGITYAAGADHDADVAMSKTKLAFFKQLIHAPDELTARTGVDPDLAPETLDVYLRVRGIDHATIDAIAKNYKGRQYFTDIGTTAFLAHCEQPKQQALLQALDHARKKADVLAGVLHTRVAELGAANADVPGSFGTICGLAPNVPLAALIAAAPPKASGVFFDNPQPTFSATVNTAWLLANGRAGDAPLKSYMYHSTIRADAPSFALELKALKQTALEALVDNDHVTSMYEAESSMDTYRGTTSASDTLIVLR